MGDVISPTHSSVKTTTGTVTLNPLRETVEMEENTSYGPVRVQSQTATQEPVYELADTIQPREDVHVANRLPTRPVYKPAARL